MSVGTDEETCSFQLSDSIYSAKYSDVTEQPVAIEHTTPQKSNFQRRLVTDFKPTKFRGLNTLAFIQEKQLLQTAKLNRNMDLSLILTNRIAKEVKVR